ncbi:MCE family protein [Nitriliruptor alkaliphilus]|uniref:MCE family protein n=1 Tax=Nitriliruptor alkaliphilus TaxID=427918 RepID=UPI000697D54E|nr:MlaD family protein [Nitriliruptor alkaliphilus]
MTTRPRHLHTLAVVLALALLTSGCGLFGGNGAYEVRAELTRSFNLFPGSPVKVLGVNVGQITDIVVPDGAQHVEVIMRIDGDVDVPEDSSAIVVPASLLGERYVQLGAYTEGTRMADGTVIPVERTVVPFEFDEVLTGLEDFVGGLEGPEVARFVANVAETLEGQGAQLGRTIDSASEAIGVLKDNDDELIALASRLADLNETLSSRDQELAKLLQDFDTVAASLVGDRGDIDAALTGLVRVTSELDGLLQVNRERLEDDIAVLTRVGRTVERNLDNVSTAVLYSAELFRHAERVVDRQRGYLPLQDQLFALGEPLTESIVFRIQGICIQAGLPGDICEIELIADLLGGVVCAAPLFPCRPDSDAIPIEEALLNLAIAQPELGDAVIDRMAEDSEAERDPTSGPGPSPDPAPAPAEEDSDDDRGLLDGLGGLLGRDREGSS